MSAGNRISGWTVAAAVAALAAACALAPGAQAGSATTGIHANPIGGQFRAPVYVTSAPGAPRLLFVVEQRGVVRVLRDGEKLERPFLDIRRRVTAGGEQGLLSIAFAPGYERNRRLYAYYTNRACGSGCDIEVAEFRRARGSATRARRASHRRVISIRHRDAANHNGGTAMFGPDRMLWLATGDGGGSDDAFDNARRKSSLLGKLLRIDPRKPQRRRAKRGYRIPRDNPFVDRGGRDEIWSLGLRNPFRFSFDSQRDAIAIGDVGQGAQEEVSFVPVAAAKGANFGWPQYEGKIEQHPDRTGPGPLIDPIYTYANPESGAAAVIGGVVLRDPRFEGVPDADPDDGIYVFADSYRGVDPLLRFEPDVATNTANDLQTLPNAEVYGAAGFGTDQRGRVYVASLFDNRVYRLDPPPEP